jgi:predicted ArsR family transcriptional regulator
MASRTGSDAERRTREVVVQLILERGPMTVAELAEHIGISTAAVRRHLDTLAAEGRVISREQRSQGSPGRGRPAREFALTEAARESFPQAYDDLAASALRFMAEHGGPEAVQAFVENRAKALEERVRIRLDGATTQEEKIAALAEALSEQGYAASAHRLASGEQLCQHHCPVAHVAAQFPQLCEAETQALSRALGTHVQRLATIARGDGMCTTHVPLTALAPPHRRAADRMHDPQHGQAPSQVLDHEHNRQNATQPGRTPA